MSCNTFPTEVVNLPIKAVDLPTMVVNLPTEVVNLLTKAVNLPTKVVNLPTKVVILPIKVVILPTKVVHLPTKIVNLPTKAVNGPTETGHSTGSAAGAPATVADKTWNVLNGLGSMAFAYSFSFVLVEIQVSYRLLWHDWAVWYITRLLVESTLKRVVFSFLLFAMASIGDIAGIRHVNAQLGWHG